MKAGPHICSYLMAKVIGFTKMIDKKNTYRLFSRFFWFLPGVNCVCGAFDDYPVSNKICKITTNHSHLLSVGDDRKFV